MKKMWKKAIAMLLVVIMIGGAAPLGALILRASAKNYSGTCGENLTWSLDTETGELTISGTGAMNDFDYDYYEYSCWHPYASSIQSIIFDNEVTSIGNYAFYGCDHLNEVSIPDSVTRIGFAAFSKCNGISRISIPNNVTAIDACAFYDCSGLISLVIGEKVNTIGNCAFKDCTALKALQYNAKECAYAGAEPTDNSWYFWGACRVSPAFYNCTSLQDVVFDEEVTTIPSNLFYSCSHLSQIKLPSNLIHVGENAFFGTALYTDTNNWTGGVLYIDNSLITTDRILSGTYAVREGTVCLADNALKGCADLSVLDIPESVLGIGTGVFDGCGNLAEIRVAADNPAYCSDTPGVLYDKAKTVLIRCPASNTVDKYVVPAGILRIEDNAFFECVNLSVVDLPDSVSIIGDSAFENCKNLTAVRFPNELSEIGTRAFRGCANLSSIDLPDCVTEIGKYSFNGCYRLGAIHIPDSITVIRSYSFAECGLKSVTLGNNVKAVESYAFDKNPIQNITFGPSVKEIGQIISPYLWADYSGLKSVCYSGTVEQWLMIKFDSSYSNNPLLSAPRYYHTHDDSMPTEVRNAKEATCDRGALEHDGYTGDVVYLPCGAIKVAGKVIPAPDHDYVITETSATCSQPGQTTAICSRCGDHDYLAESYIPPLGHDWDGGTVTREPTCTEKGIITYTCKRDASHTREEYTPAKGHMFGAWQQTKVPTVETEGAAQRKCSVCGEVEAITLAKLPATEKLTLNKASITLNYKDSETLTASEAVTWSSSNEKVVKVDPATGKLTTVGKGTATITAHSVQGDKTATCEVTVKYTFIQMLIRIFLLGFIWY